MYSIGRINCAIPKDMKIKYNTRIMENSPFYRIFQFINEVARYDVRR